MAALCQCIRGSVISALCLLFLMRATTVYSLMSCDDYQEIYCTAERSLSNLLCLILKRS